MKKYMLVTAMAGLCCGMAAHAQTYTSTTTPVAINDTPTVDDVITVPASFTLGDVDVLIDITHTFDGDLDIVLIPPGGVDYVHLCSDVGGAGDNFVQTTFDQQAPTAITAGVAPFTGRFRPEGGAIAWIGTIPLPATALANLDSLIGRNSAGNWTLRIDDDAAIDVGFLNTWSLILRSTVDPTPINGALTLTPNSGAVGTSVVAAVTIFPGQNPPSTGVTVSLDASAIDGGSVTLRDNGVFPDQAAGDNIFSGQVSVGGNAAIGPQTVSFAASDAQSRSANGSATFTVRPEAARNDSCESAIPLTGPLPITTPGEFIAGNNPAVEQPLSCSTGGGNNAGYSIWYSFVPTESTTHRFNTSVALATGNNVADTVIAIYEASGTDCSFLTEVGCDDDSGDGLQSLEDVFLNAGTTYYIQVAKWALGAPTDVNTLGLYIEIPTTPPSASIALDPTTGAEGTSVTASVTVTPGSNPVSQSYTVFLDASSVLGAAQNILDDGVAPDLIANDGTFTGTFVVGVGAPIGNQPITYSVTDDQGRLANGTANFNVIEIPTGACCTGRECQIVRQTECAALSGTYLGDGVPCSSNDGYVSNAGNAALEDISATGNFLTLTDDSNANATIGFDFTFFSNTYFDCFVGSNGFVSFGAGSNALGNVAIPNAAVPNNVIYGLWDDLNPGVGGSVQYETRGTPGVDQRFIVQWTNVPQFAQTDSNTFQIILFQNGSVEMRYGFCSAFTDADATVGIENADGTAATSVPGSSVAEGVSFNWAYRTGEPACGASCGWQADGCYADYNNDSGIDADDVISFFGDWDSGQSCADVDASGGVDSDDVITFFASWDASGSGTPGC